ncbi:MAG: hypothetical protein V4672_03925 [Verrucomicrobiota bacterium]
MQDLGIHIFGLDGVEKDGTFFIDQCALCMRGEKGELAEYTKYWKMPQSLDIHIVYHNVALKIDELILQFGKNPVFRGEREVIFDTNKGSELYPSDVRWLHLELYEPRL